MSLVSLSPADVLKFKLGRDFEARAVLEVTNTSQSRIVFKVKTTQPSWYYVRPNQQVLDIGQTEEVAIVLVEAEGNRFLDLYAADKAEKLDKHRFMVQSKAIEDEDFQKLNSLQLAQKSEEFTRLWESGLKDDRKNLKLKVEFIYPDAKDLSGDAKTRSVSENVDMLRNRLARTETPNSSNIESASSASPEAIFAELTTLRKKYDAVVEYTVHLTAERDTIVAQLEELQREFTREMSRKKDGTPKGSSKIEKVERKIKGFSLLLVIFAAIVSYLAGRFLKF